MQEPTVQVPQVEPVVGDGVPPVNPGPENASADGEKSELKKEPRHVRGPVPGAPRISTADIARAIEFCDFDLVKAAEKLGISEHALTCRISNSPQLSTLFRQKGETKIPTAISTMVREVPKELADIERDSEIGEKLMMQNRQLLRSGLKDAGIKQTTIDKLETFDKFAVNTGSFLLASIDLSHRSMIFLMVHLIEQAISIKAEYLDNATLDDEIKIEWQHAFTDLVEQVGRCHDRTLLATQAMAKMIEGDKLPEEKRKPGFKPLKRVEPTKTKAPA